MLWTVVWLKAACLLRSLLPQVQAWCEDHQQSGEPACSIHPRMRSYLFFCCSLSFLWRRACLNFILPLMKLTPDGPEAEEETHLSQTKTRNLPNDGAAKVSIHFAQKF